MEVINVLAAVSSGLTRQKKLLGQLLGEDTNSVTSVNLMRSNELHPVHSDEQGLQGESPPSRVPIDIDAKRNLAEGIKDIDGLQKKVEGVLFKDSEEKWDYITINKLRAHLREEVEKRKGDLTLEEEKAAARVGVAVGGGGARGSEDLAVSKLALETVSLDLKKVTER